MRLTRFVKGQVIVFALLALLSGGFTLVTYAGLGEAVGGSGYTVEAEFTDVSGLYERANVTYRGVTVGRVGELRMRDGRPVVPLEIESDVPIPRDVIASMHSTSAIGEQYVDLVPAERSRGGSLGEGDVITSADTRVMPQIGPMLDKVNSLLASVPRAATERVLGQLSTGLEDGDSDVAGTVIAASELVSAAEESLRETEQLLDAARPVLSTQRAVAPQTRAYLHALAQLAGTLVSADRDIAQVLRSGPGALTAAGDLADDLEPVLPPLLGNAHNAVAPVAAYRVNLEQTLVTYPYLLASLQSVLTPRAAFGEAKLDLTGNIGNPGSCTAGYRSAAQRRSPVDTSIRPVEDLLYCRAAPGDPRGVRGARNDPCPNRAARAATARACGLTFAGAVGSDGVRTRSFAGRALLDGVYVAPSGIAVPAPATIRPGRGDFPWITLITAPLGL